MPAKKKPAKKPGKRQKQGFIEFYKCVGADDDAVLERTFGTAVPPKS